jgi:hypothetical protein
VAILGVLLLVMMGQGAVILATAYFGLRILKVRKPARSIAVLLSWAAWNVFTVMGYAGLGGSFGFLDGLAVIVTLCMTSAISSVVFLLVWASWPARSQRVAGN